MSGPMLPAEDLGEEQKQHGLVKQTAWGWEKKGAGGRQSSHSMCSGVIGKETEKHGIRILGLEMQTATCEDWAA